jgi:potassium efflux system protein
MASRSKTLTDVERKQILDLYDQAIQSLQEEIRFKGIQLGHERRKRMLESDLAAAQVELSTSSQTLPAPAKPQSVREAEDAILQTAAEINTRRNALANLSKLPQSLSAKRVTVTDRRAAIRQSLEEISDELIAVNQAATTPEWTQANRRALQARSRMLQQEMLTLGAEREALDVQLQLAPIQRDLAQTKLEGAQSILGQLRTQATEAARAEAKQALESNHSAAVAWAKQYPALAPVAQVCEGLAAKLWGSDGVLEQTRRYRELAQQAKTYTGQVKQIDAVTRRRFEAVRLFASAEEWWPNLPAEIPQVTELWLDRLVAEGISRKLQSEIVDLEEDQSSDVALQAELAALRSRSNIPKDAGAEERFEATARQAVQTRRRLTNDLLSAARDCRHTVESYTQESAELQRELESLNRFLYRRVLWVRSVRGAPVPNWRDFWGGITWIVANKEWPELVRGVLKSAQSAVFVAAVLALFLLLRRKILLWWSASDPANVSSSPLKVLFLSGTLHAGLVPAVLLGAAWVVHLADDLSLGRGIASGLQGAAIILFLLGYLKILVKEGSFTRTRLQWPDSVCDAVRKEVRWLIYVLPPLAFVTMTLAADGMSFHGDRELKNFNNSLGRACLVAAWLCAAVASGRVLRPSGPAAQAVPAGSQRRVLVWRLFSRPLMLSLLLLPPILALLGYYITAYLLGRNLIWTFAITFAVGVGVAVVRVWRESREAELSAPGAPPAARAAIDLTIRQVRQMSRFGFMSLWMVCLLWVWSDMLPALTALRSVELLPKFRIVNIDSTGDQVAATATPAPAAPPAAAQPAPSSNPLAALQPAASQQAAPPASREEPLTLFDVLMALAAALLTLLIVLNVPGLLDLTLLRHFRLDAGARYAVSTIVRYLLILIGAGVVSGFVGITWSKIQWLVAALTFGIGFGLQEIFANFAAGLILLLDRSIRVGDAVTVGDLSGEVSRIQMRATTITLWDRSDMVVPNKEFITSKLVNWTLSYPETRIDVKVGVSYESDIELVRQVLMDIATNHPAVLRDPAPAVFLTEFAASSINFEMRVFILFAYGRPVAQDELQRSVVAEFRKHGINIAFPQLEVHLSPSQGTEAEKQIASRLEGGFRQLP